MKNTKCLTKEQQKIVEDNINLAYNFAHKYGVLKYNYNFEEAVSISFLGLVKAVLAWDENKGKLSTLAYTVMHNEFKILLRKDKYNTYSFISLQAPVSNEKEDISIEDIIPEKENILSLVETNSMVEYAYNKLSENGKKVVTYYLNHPEISQTKLAKILNISQPQVSRILIKFRNLINDQS